MVKRVDVLYPGDEHHNGRLRRVIYKMPLGREGSALELVTDVEPERGYTYTMISSTPGNDQIGHVRLEPLGPNRTRFHFDERYNLQKAPFKWFEGPIYGSSTRTTKGRCAAPRPGSRHIPSTAPTSPTPDRSGHADPSRPPTTRYAKLVLRAGPARADNPRGEPAGPRRARDEDAG